MIGLLAAMQGEEKVKAAPLERLAAISQRSIFLRSCSPQQWSA
jgi:hypothetical protein